MVVTCIDTPTLGAEASLSWWGFPQTLLILTLLLEKGSETGYSKYSEGLKVLFLCLDSGAVPGVTCG